MASQTGGQGHKAGKSWAVRQWCPGFLLQEPKHRQAQPSQKRPGIYAEPPDPLRHQRSSRGPKAHDVGRGPGCIHLLEKLQRGGPKVELLEAGEGHVANDKVWLQLLPLHLLQEASTKFWSSQVQSTAEGSIGHGIQRHPKPVIALPQQECRLPAASAPTGAHGRGAAENIRFTPSHQRSQELENQIPAQLAFARFRRGVCCSDRLLGIVGFQEAQKMQCLLPFVAVTARI